MKARRDGGISSIFIQCSNKLRVKLKADFIPSVQMRPVKILLSACFNSALNQTFKSAWMSSLLLICKQVSKVEAFPRITSSVLQLFNIIICQMISVELRQIINLKNPKPDDYFSDHLIVFPLKTGIWQTSEMRNSSNGKYSWLKLYMQIKEIFCLSSSLLSRPESVLNLRNGKY